MPSVSAAWKASFLRRAFLLAGIWLAGATVVAAVAWGSLFSHLDNELTRTEQRALLDIRKLSYSYGANLRQTISAIDQLILSIKYGWEISEGTLRLDEMKDAGILLSTPDFYVAIFDASGNMITNTVPGSAPINASNRPFFMKQKEAMADYLFVGEADFGLYTQRDIIRFSRKLLDRNRQFAGVVLVGVTTRYLTTNYESMGLGAHDFLGIVGEDGIVRVTRIGGTVRPVNAPALTAVPTLPSPIGSAEWNGERWFADNRTRYVGWSAIPLYPLIALAGLDKWDALASYRSYRAATIRNGILVSAALTLLTLVAAMLSIRLSWRKHMHDQVHSIYRMATESGTEGFYIIHPLRRDGEVVDFEFLDCNRRGAAFLGREPEGVIGTRISDFYGGPMPRPMMDTLMEGMAKGEYEGDVKLMKDSFIKLEWMHLKLIRSDDEIAMTVRDISETKAHVKELEKRGNEDSLTGLPNRHWATNFLPRAISAAQENKAMLALLFIDLDGFKTVNDTMGHDAGDELLRNAAKRLKLAVRPGDHVVRMGGDEFIVIIENIHQKADAAHVAGRVLHAFDEVFKLSKGISSVGASIGISMFPTDGNDTTALLKNADIAMYSVKTAGKRGFRFYDQKFDEALNARHQKETELRQAIAEGQFVVYFQPTVQMSTGTMSSMEALVRWDHPTRGLLEPSEFIPFAEETGLIVGLGELILDKVCAQLAEWATHRQDLVPVSINVSPRQFDDTNIGRSLERSLQRHHVDASLLEIELTESSMMESGKDVGEALASIRRLGVKLLIDDFGSGYSSLSQLRRFHVDGLKIDSVFTSELGESGEGKPLFTAIITMAHALGIRVVAEGVENREQMEILKSLRCDEIQGFYVSKPLPPSETQPVGSKWLFSSAVH